MKRANLLDRVRLLAEKRIALVMAAKEAARTDLSRYATIEAEKELEIRAIEFGVTAVRYLGGKTP